MLGFRTERTRAKERKKEKKRRPCVTTNTKSACMLVELARTLPLLCSLPSPQALLTPLAPGAAPSRARIIKCMDRSSQGVLWDVDGTLVESTDLAFIASNEVLEANGFPAITVEQYKIGCKYTTPER